MEIFLYFSVFSLNLLLGFILGYTKAKPELIEKTIKRITDKKASNATLGTVKRPTAEQLRERGTVEAEGKQAMEDTLDGILPNSPK